MCILLLTGLNQQSQHNSSKFWMMRISSNPITTLFNHGFMVSHLKFQQTHPIQIILISLVIFNWDLNHKFWINSFNLLQFIQEINQAGKEIRTRIVSKRAWVASNKYDTVLYHLMSTPQASYPFALGLGIIRLGIINLQIFKKIMRNITGSPCFQFEFY